MLAHRSGIIHQDDNGRLVAAFAPGHRGTVRLGLAAPDMVFTHQRFEIFVDFERVESQTTDSFFCAERIGVRNPFQPFPVFDCLARIAENSNVYILWRMMNDKVEHQPPRQPVDESGAPIDGDAAQLT